MKPMFALAALSSLAVLATTPVSAAVLTCPVTEQCSLGESCRAYSGSARLELDTEATPPTVSLGPQTLALTEVGRDGEAISYSAYDPLNASSAVVTLTPDGKLRLTSHRLDRSGRNDFTLFADCSES